MQQLFMNNYNLFTDYVSDQEFQNKLWLTGEDCEHMVKYFDETVENVLKEYFELKKCPNRHVWFGEWENHRRMVIKLDINSATYDIQFGYNYDFIPRLNRQKKFVYYRTEKAVGLDVMDLYLNHIWYDPDRLTHGESFNIRRHYVLNMYGRSSEIDLAKKYLENVVRNNIPFMQDFYERYNKDEEMIEFLDHTIKEGNMFERHWYIWTKAFLFARLQDMDQAEKTMREYYSYVNGAVPEKVLEKLESVKDM